MCYFVRDTIQDTFCSYFMEHQLYIFTSIFVQPLHIGHIIIGLYRAAHETGQFQAPVPKPQDNKPKKDRQ